MSSVCGRHHKYRQCENATFCGHLLQRAVQKKAGGREYAAETRNSERVQREGRERAQLVREGMFVGGECTNETEPYIIAIALSGPMVWRGEAGSCWMGKITEGAYLCFLCF
jgi:hypothetical protein